MGVKYGQSPHTTLTFGPVAIGSVAGVPSTRVRAACREFHTGMRESRVKPPMSPPFDIKAFLDSGGVSRKVVRRHSGQVVYA